MTRKEFEQIMNDESFEYALEEFSQECEYVKPNGSWVYGDVDYYRMDWNYIYGYPISDGDRITSIDDIDDLFEEE